MNSETWAAVPVKRLVESKSRLAAVLTAEERYLLSCCLLEHTLDLLLSVQDIDQVIVVSCDQVALETALGRGAGILREMGQYGMNAALSYITEAALVRSVDTLIMMPVDLPLADSEDIGSALELMRTARAKGPDMDRVVAAAPDQAGDGTNLMILHPPGIIECEFGQRSYLRHRTTCLANGIPFLPIVSPKLALDLDTPSDLATMAAEIPITTVDRSSSIRWLTHLAMRVTGGIHCRESVTFAQMSGRIGTGRPDRYAGCQG